MPSESNQPSDPHSFDLAEVDAAIAGTEFAGALHYLVSTPSTNDLAHAAAYAGARHGVWIAGEQTAGRGRGGHSWHSAAGAEDAPDGLYMSALISPNLPMQRAQHLSLATAIAVQSAICSVTGFRIREDIDIRWPNDLLLNGRKVAGILVQLVDSHAIAGLGINVNHTAFPPELAAEATSLRLAAGRSVAREEILLALLPAIDAFTAESGETILRLFTHASSYACGRRVTVEQPGGPIAGTTAGLDPAGYLRVRQDDGTVTLIVAGGVRAAGS